MQPQQTTSPTQTPTKTKPAENPAPQPTARPNQEARELTPPIDVYESAEGLTVELEVPGVPSGALTLSLEQDHLTISAMREAAPLDVPVRYVRTLVIPRDIDRDTIEAKLDAGLLTLTLPRAASARPRQIPIKSS